MAIGDILKLRSLNINVYTRTKLLMRTIQPQGYNVTEQNKKHHRQTQKQTGQHFNTIFYIRVRWSVNP